MADLDIALEDQSAVVLDVEGDIQFPAKLTGAGGVTITRNGFDYVISLDTSGITYSWNNLIDRPATFAPSVHMHPTSEVVGLDTAIAGIGTSLAAKAPLASPTFTGTVSGVTAAMVGLGNVNNTSDANKPVSTAQATAIALKLAIASNLSDLASISTALTNLGFASSQGNNGYVKIPAAGGTIIIQWGRVTFGGASSATVTLPTAYPTAHAIAIASHNQGSTVVTSTSSPTLTQFTINMSAGLTGTAWWVSVGY